MSLGWPEGDELLVRMTVDADRCLGVGQCELLEPGVFAIDDDEGIAGVVEPGLLPLERALAVAERCPSAAIGHVAVGASAPGGGAADGASGGGAADDVEAGS